MALVDMDVDQQVQARKRRRSLSPGTSLRRTGGHIFESIKLTGHARAIIGDVYESCPDFIVKLSVEQERRTLINAIHYVGIHDRIAQILNAAPETCDYVWSTPFSSWLCDGSNKEFFWLSGKPGSGKSTLMKYLVRNPKTQRQLQLSRSDEKPWTIIHFFFDFRAASSLANTQDGLFRSLLYQIVSALPFTASVLKSYQLDIEHILISQLLDSTIDTIVKIIRQQGLRILLLIDGLDETATNLRQLIQSVSDIHARCNTDAYPSIRICLASRPEPAIRSILDGLPTMRIQDYSRPGIDVYVRNSIKDIKAAFLYQPPSENLVEEIIRQTEGVFLWVHYAVEIVVNCLVRGCSEAETLIEVGELPTDLEKMYERIFENIPFVCRPEAALILCLLKDATHPVTLGGLFRIWTFLSRQASPGGVASLELTITNFKIRLQGFLGGFLDFVPPKTKISQWKNGPANVTDTILAHWPQDTDEDRSPQNCTTGKSVASLRTGLYVHWTTWRTALEKAEKNEGLPNWQQRLLRQPESMAANPWEEIRLLHETLRAYLRRSQICDRWIDRTLLKSYSDNLWLRVSTEVIIAADQTTNAIGLVGKILQPNTSAVIPDEFGPAAVLFDLGSAISMSFRGMNKEELIPMILDAILYLVGAPFDTLAEEDSALQKQLESALRSPLILLADILRYGMADRFSSTTRLRARSDLADREDTPNAATFWSPAGFKYWRHDFALAAAQRRLAYLERRILDLVALPSEQKNYIFGSAFSIRLIFEGTAPWRFSMTPEQEKIMDLLLKMGGAESVHIAAYLASQAHADPPACLLTTQNKDRYGAANPFDPFIRSGRLDRWPFLRRDNMHVLEMWARLPSMSSNHYSKRLALLEAYGVNIHSFRHTNGSCIVKLVLDACLNFDSFSDVMSKLQILGKREVDFFVPDERGRTAMWHIHALLKDMKRIDEVHKTRVETGEISTWRNHGNDELDRSLNADDVVRFEALLRHLEEKRQKSEDVIMQD